MQQPNLETLAVVEKNLLSLLKQHPNPSSDLSELLSFIFATDRNQLLALSRTKQLTEAESQRFKIVLEQLEEDTPIAYITGSTEFFGLKMQVCKNVLIPRPETEQLVELVLEELTKFKQRPEILEVGVGSGCIATAITRDLCDKGIEFSYLGVDINTDAISCTKNNLTLQNLDTIKLQKSSSSIEIQQADILTQNPSTLGNLNCIISNPPYLTDLEMENLSSSVSNFEPYTALHGGPKGLDFYERILEIASQQPNIQLVALEVSPATAPEVKKIYATAFKECVIKNDLFGRKRFVIAKN